MGFGFHGFDVMFTIVPVLVAAGFVFVIGMFIITAVRGAKSWSQNNHAPKLTVPASVVTKRANVTHRRQDAGEFDAWSSSTRYYVTFQVESGDRLELHVSGPEYGMLAEGDQGQLTFQGTRYLSFVRT